MTQLADDTTLFVKDIKDIQNAISTINTFGKYSGLALNINKTEGMWIGKSKLSTEQIGNIKWSDKVKVLGVFLEQIRQTAKI